MAVVQGVREKVHLPIYDSVAIEAGEQLRDVESSNTLKFFVDVQKKTKLETNLQSASLLPHYNTFEARALRVVISDLPPDFGEELVEVKGTNGMPLSEVIDKIRAGEPNPAMIGEATFTVADLKAALEDLDIAPIDAQVDDDNTTAVINRLIYNTVTTLYVGEKIMIQMPTWFFPAGAGACSEGGTGATHGVPSPSDTFRFAEPIFIEKQQNFRVEIEVPDSEVLRDLQRIYGPMYIWVVLDGYMTRSVQ
ncbi:MAG: hypothetical protein ACKV22_40080 [Bryobacteraceae bacterium]